MSDDELRWSELPRELRTLVLGYCILNKGDLVIYTDKSDRMFSGKLIAPYIEEPDALKVAFDDWGPEWNERFDPDRVVLAWDFPQRFPPIEFFDIGDIVICATGGAPLFELAIIQSFQFSSASPFGQWLARVHRLGRMSRWDDWHHLSILTKTFPLINDDPVIRKVFQRDDSALRLSDAEEHIPDVQSLSGMVKLLRSFEHKEVRRPSFPRSFFLQYQ